MRISSKVTEALEVVGARLKRHKKHLVYELPNGRNVVVAKTPSDVHAEQNALREIRVAAGVVKAEKPAARAKRPKPGRAEAPWTLPVSSLGPALRDAGLIEAALRERIKWLETESGLQAAHVASLEAERDALKLELHHRRSWWQRVRVWLAR